MNIDELVYSPLRQLSFRGKYRLSNIIVPKVGARTTRIFGSSMELDLSDYIQRSMYAGLYEVEDVAWFRTVLRPGMVFVDVGANVGFYTALGASIVGKGGRVLAFEPDPYAFGKLDRFVRCNDLSQVECKALALSDQAHSLTLFVPPKSYGNHNPSTAQYCNDMIAQKIPATTLDRCFENLGLNSIDLLKIDVEGHELRVLLGGQRCIGEGRVKRILCEFNEKMLSLNDTSSHELYEWLSTAGYRDLCRASGFGVTAGNRRFVFNAF